MKLFHIALSLLVLTPVPTFAQEATVIGRGVLQRP